MNTIIQMLNQFSYLVEHAIQSLHAIFPSETFHTTRTTDYRKKFSIINGYRGQLVSLCSFQIRILNEDWSQ